MTVLSKSSWLCPHRPLCVGCGMSRPHFCPRSSHCCSPSQKLGFGLGAGSTLMGQLLLGVDVPSESFVGGKADVVSAWGPGYGVSHPESTFTFNLSKVIEHKSQL